MSVPPDQMTGPSGPPQGDNFQGPGWAPAPAGLQQPSMVPRPEDMRSPIGADPNSPYGPDAAKTDYAQTGQMLPGFLSFDRVFEAQYPHMPEEFHSIAQSLVQHLSALYGAPGKAGTWQPMASEYTYAQYLHDIAVVATSMKPNGGGEFARRAAARNPTTVEQPPPAPTSKVKGPQ